MEQRSDIKISNGDRIRSMADEELVELLFSHYLKSDDAGDISKHWCDGKAGCINGDGDVECSEERHKACILRWLRSPENGGT